MMTSISLKEVERRAYRSTFEDGLYDMPFGLVFLIIGWLPVLETLGVSRYLGYLLFLLPVLLPPIAKRYVTIPRLGSVEFGSKRKQRSKYFLLAGGVVLFLTLPLLIMMIARDGLAVESWMAITLFAAPLVVLAVLSIDFPRMYLYAAVLAAAIVQSEFLLPIVGTPLNAILSFGLPGAAIFLFGLSLLMKFVTRYPKQTAAESHDHQ